MKCESCGAPLKIEYNVCPNCGTPNPFAKGHREDMEKYSKAFDETRSAVIKKTRNTFGIMIKIVISLVLIIASVVCLFMSKGVHTFNVSSKLRHISAHKEEYKREADILEESRDYIGFTKWYELNHIARRDDFREYYDIYIVSSYYSSLVEEVLAISDAENVSIVYDTLSGKYDRIAQSIVKMRNRINDEPKTDVYNSRTPRHMEAMNDAYNEAKLIVKAVFCLSDEDAAKLDTESEAKIAVILEESWPYGE